MTKILFAAAEMSPLARVGGLAEAAAGLVAELRRRPGVTMDIVLPDYSGEPLAGVTTTVLDVPDWVGGATARTGTHAVLGEVTLIDTPGMAKPHPYVDVDGSAWPDNDHRFFSFSAAVAALAKLRQPDVLHLNDWHTALATSFAPEIPTVLTIHTLGYQGTTNEGWLARLPHDAFRFAWFGSTNPVAGALELADAVIAVSPTYAREILTQEHGMGLEGRLQALGDRLIGIRNGIDTQVWDPTVDAHLASTFDASTLAKRALCRDELLSEVGWKPNGDPVFGMIGRLVHQKGVDTLVGAARYLDSMPGRLIVLGSGEADLSKQLRMAMDSNPDRIWFLDGYEVELGHRIFGGVDFLCMPSRFEPCGLAQMQAMQYGALPVVFDVGGLHDTVVDLDADPANGTGIVASSSDVTGLVDAMHRATRAFRNDVAFQAAQQRGMQADWSWKSPANTHLKLYKTLA